MPDGLNPIVKRYLKGTVESQGKELTWETDDLGFLFIVDGKYYEVPYKEFIYEGPDEFIQFTNEAVIDRSIVGIYRTIAAYCTELLMHPETFSYYDEKLVTGHLGNLLAGQITTDKGKFPWRVTSESVEVDCVPRASMMYVSHKYYTSQIWQLLAPTVPYNVCQMFVIISRLYMRCTKFEEPEVVLSLEEIQRNIQMRQEAERRQKEMEAMRKAEEARMREASAKKLGGGVDIGLGGGVDIELGGGGSMYGGTATAVSQTAASVAASQGVPLELNQGAAPQSPQMPVEEPPQFETIPLEPVVEAVATPAAEPAQLEAVPPAAMEVAQPEVAEPAAVEIAQPAGEVVEAVVEPVAMEVAQPEAVIESAAMEVVQPEAVIEPVAVEVAQPEIEQPVVAAEPVAMEMMQPEMAQPEAEAQEAEEAFYMQAVMNYLEEMDLPTKNPERSIRKYYPEWALEPIKHLTGDEFLMAFAKLL